LCLARWRRKGKEKFFGKENLSFAAGVFSSKRGGRGADIEGGGGSGSQYKIGCLLRGRLMRGVGAEPSERGRLF